jgi:hypothetical protein
MQNYKSNCLAHREGRKIRRLGGGLRVSEEFGVLRGLFERPVPARVAARGVKRHRTSDHGLPRCPAHLAPRREMVHRQPEAADTGLGTRSAD